MNATASHFDNQPNALLGCQVRSCHFTGRPANFIDARDYPHNPSDSFDCPCCGYSKVVELTYPPSAIRN